MKKTITFFCLVAAASFGLGALSDSIIAQLRNEFQTRASRELVNADLMRGLSPSGKVYFEGRAAGYDAASKINIDPLAWAYLRGFGETLVQSSEEIFRAQESHTVTTK